MEFLLSLVLKKNWLKINKVAENTSFFILIQSSTVDAIVTAANNEYLNIEYNRKNFTIRIKKILRVRVYRGSRGKLVLMDEKTEREI